MIWYSIFFFFIVSLFVLLTGFIVKQIWRVFQNHKKVHAISPHEVVGKQFTKAQKEVIMEYVKKVNNKLIEGSEFKDGSTNYIFKLHPDSPLTEAGLDVILDKFQISGWDTRRTTIDHRTVAVTFSVPENQVRYRLEAEKEVEEIIRETFKSSKRSL